MVLLGRAWIVVLATHARAMTQLRLRVLARLDMHQSRQHRALAFHLLQVVRRVRPELLVPVARASRRLVPVLRAITRHQEL